MSAVLVDPPRLALERALASARTDRAERLTSSDALIAELEAALSAAGGPGVPLKEAAFALGVSADAMRKRALRGAGYKIETGHWLFPRSYVEAHRRVRSD